MTSQKLVAESWENRGTTEVPFGFVYFSDGSRVGYSQGYGVWQPNTNGGGQYQPVTQKHLEMAADVLAEAGINPFENTES